MKNSAFSIRAITDNDRAWVREFMIEHWGAEMSVVRGEPFWPHQLPGFGAETADGECIGLATYRLLDDATGELATIDSLRSGLGVGAALVHAVADAVRAQGRQRLIVVTTNDNLHALRFYQRHGFVLAVLRVNALAASRTLKPQIPLVGLDGIPLRDEIELEMRLGGASD
ncbi:MAG: GNAT family N-acetyltransferase [Caldilineaceae bacterium]